MVETNGGSSVEQVSGFNPARALTSGFPTKRISGPTFLASIADGGFFSVAPAALQPNPPVTAAKPENVIGFDDRVLVTDTTRTPWRCICHLEITYETGAVGFGTGWFAGPHVVVTAGHCVYDRASRRRATQIRVIPGRNTSLAPYGYVVATRFAPSPGWDSLPDATDENDLAAHDYAAIFLHRDEEVGDAPFGERIGYFGLREFDAAEKAELEMVIVNNAGYPQTALKPYGSMWFNAGRVHRSEAARPDERFLEYMVDTEGGESGSPVFIYDSTKNQRLVVAIHTTGNFVNRGVRVTSEVFDQISSWIDDP
jgi:V8-like Glu-specific endopeptidase